jgi:dUTP pyrophosphatase
MANDAEEILKLFGGAGSMDEDDAAMYDEIFEKFGIDVKELEKQMITDSQDYKVNLGFEKINDDAVTPKYNFGDDSGFDLHTVEEIVLPPFGRALAPTGLKFNLPKGYEMQVRSKSGLAINQGLMVLNSPGTVDLSYKGEIKVILFNTNNSELVITKGQKVGQAVICPVAVGRHIRFVEEIVDINSSERKDGGFGSTGI